MLTTKSIRHVNR